MLKSDFDKLVLSEQPVLIDFWAAWCAPCRSMLPILDEIALEMGERVNIVKIDVDQSLDLAVAMRVMGVPTFMLYKNGQCIWKDAGTFTKETLKQKIEDAELH